MSTAALESRSASPAHGHAHRVGSAAQAAGFVLALAQLSGYLEGSLFLLGGALALVAAGRVLEEETAEAWTTAFCYVIIIGSLGAVALRWGSPFLESWRGVEAVIGPPLVVGPTGAAAGSGAAFAAGLIAAALLLVPRFTSGTRGRVFGAIESLLVALALVTAFWGPELPPGAEASRTLLEVARWAGLTVAVAAAAWGGAFLLRRLSPRIRLILLVVAGAALVVGSALVAGNS